MTRRAAAAGLLLTLLAALFSSRASAKMPDFEVYWRAGHRAVAGEPLYRAEDGHYQFKYLPAFALLAAPATLLPLRAAKAAWFFTSAALIAVLLTLGLRLLPDRRRRPWVLALLTFVLMAKFYGHELILGQANLLLGVVIVGGVICLRASHPIAAGLLVALAVIVKPYAVLFVPWLAAQRMRAGIAAVAGVAAALVAPAAFYGVTATLGLHLDWWRTVTDSTAPNLLNADNVSLAAMFAKWFGAGAQARWMAAAGSVALLLAAALVFVRRGGVNDPAGLEAALLLTLIPLLSPQGWDYVFLLATPAVLFLANFDASLPSMQRVLTWGALALAGLTIYDIVGRAAYATFMRLSLVSVCYLVVCASLLTLRLRRIA